MNERSSRSHCVFTCTLESKSTDGTGATTIRNSRLHLVDLAGGFFLKCCGGTRGICCEGWVGEWV